MTNDQQVEGGATAGKMNPVQKKWLAYWLLVLAASVIFLDNHIDAASKDQLMCNLPHSSRHDAEMT